MTRVGWIGLGAMGGPMAACAVRAGHELRAYDVDPERVPEGVEAAADAAGAARGADVLVLMVATPEQAQAALDDVRLEPGTIVLVMATVGPEPVARWAREHEVVDAPVSGGVARAAEGDLLIMVAGAA